MMKDTLDSLPSIEFGRLYSQYKQPFAVFAYGYIRDQMVVEDIVSDSFLAFWENRHKLPGNTNIPGYILTTVRNKSLNWLKEQATHHKIEESIKSMSQRAIQANIRSLELCDPKDLFEGEISAIVSHELDGMPELRRKIFTENRYHDKTYGEIARENDITVRHVEYELKKAVKSFALALKDYLPSIIILLSAGLLS